VKGPKLYTRAVASLDDDTEAVAGAHAIFVQITPLEHFKGSFGASGSADFYSEGIAHRDRSSG
jgi:hypothetical protein